MPAKITKAKLHAIVVDYFALRQKIRKFATDVSLELNIVADSSDVLEFLDEISVNEEPPADADKTWESWEYV